MIMKAMIFAAGLGTRLFPLTKDKPKALIEINGVPLLEIVINRLVDAGIMDIVVNVHHFANQIIDFLEARFSHLSVQVSDESGLLLETGGGLRKAAPFLGEAAFLAVNADILSNIDINTFVQFHHDHGGIATLAVRDRVSSRNLLFDENLLLCGWQHNGTQERRMSRNCLQTTPLSFSGMQVIHPDIFNFMPQTNKFSIIDVYLAAAQSEKIVAYSHDEDIWLDVGKLDAIAKAERIMDRI